MKRERVLVPLVRLAFLAFCLVTSGYCLLAYVPFTYTQLIEARIVGWVAAFADGHVWLYWILLALLATTFVRRGASRALLLGLAVAGAALVVHPVLPTIANDATALVWAIAALVPLAAVGIVDLLGHRRALAWGQADRADDLRLFAAVLGSALLVTILYATPNLGHLGGAGLLEKAFVALSSLAAHGLLFTGLYLVLLLGRGIAGFSAAPARAEFLFGALLVAVGVAAAVGRLVLPALSVTGAPGFLYAASIGAAVALFLAGLAVRIRPLESAERVESGIGLLLAPLGPPRGSAVAAALALAAIAGCAFSFVSATAIMDWNHLFRRLTALMIWPLALAWMEATLPRWRAARGTLPIAVLAGCIVSVSLFRVTEPAPGADPASLLGKYAEYDGSYGLIEDTLALGEEAAADEEGFFDYLQKHTNISRAIPIAPIDVNLARSLEPSSAFKPNIFIFVIDSLRQDYLSPYNPKVGFTPEIERFARDGVVFRNTFTHYGATGLSEPAIWVGGLLVHRQYVMPFHPMNSLEKLLRAEGYRCLVSMDSILRVLLQPSPALLDLDSGIANKDYAFCRTLEALVEKIASDKEDRAPLFVYTQPQDIHVSVITRQGASVPPGETYPGFYAPYASRIRGMDACFGRFLEELKVRGLYDESLIVLTSDHGDSLGEGGRWGHAYTLFPEIVRVPLLMKLPRSLQATVHADPDAVTFTTDITPTLYELLSHSPTLRGGLFGRPLFTAGRPSAPSSDGWLLASSYGPVYGLLDGEGRTLYVVDAINYEDWYFDMQADPEHERRPVTEEVRRDRRKKIRRAISSLHEFYGTGELN